MSVSAGGFRIQPATRLFVLFLLVGFWSPIIVLGQGQVQFRNYVPDTSPLIDARVRLNDGTFPDGSDPLWRAALIGGPTTATPASPGTAGTLSMLYHPANTTLSWVNFRSGTVPPLSAGYVNVGATPQRVVPGVDWGETALVQMVVWHGNFTTWADAYAASSTDPNIIVGMSNPLTLRLPWSPTDSNLTYLWGLQPVGFPLEPPVFFDLAAFSGPADQSVRAGEAVQFTVAFHAWPPPSFQWYYNGTAIPGATLNPYQIPTVQASNAGDYFAVLTHMSGAYTSLTARLTVLLDAPFITSQPQSQTALPGWRTVFKAGVSGEAPLSYFWFFNGGLPPAVGHADGPTLTVTNVSPKDSGVYILVITNVWGAVTSAPVMLNVIPPVDLSFVPGVVGSAQSGTALNVEYRDQLDSTKNWEPLAHVTLGTNTSQLYVDSSAISPARFYRAWQTNGVTQAPLLSIKLVPAIALTGQVGGSVQVDYINQVGPTDAWVRLATVILTNTSQLYLDTSAIGRPARLYRLLPIP